MTNKPKTEAVFVRRAPKYLQFALSGFVLGIVAALAFGLSQPESVGLMIVIGGVVGGTAGILFALAFDAFYRGRGKKLDATKITE